MRVQIGSIQGQKGASVSFRFEEAEPEPPEESVAFAPNSTLVVDVTVTNTGSCYLVQGSIGADLIMKCNRCLGEYPWRLETPLHETFCSEVEESPRAEAFEELEADESTDDDDERTFSGNEFDLSDAVWEQITLSLPMKLLCREDCAGICPQCGVDRNEEPCTCEEITIDPRLAALSQWSEKGSEDGSP